MSKQEDTPATPSLPACCAGLAQTLTPELFKALADPSRAQLLIQLAGRPAPVTVSEIATCCPTDLSVVSRHLALLKSAGVLEARKVGREVYYRARCNELAALLRSIADALESCCPPGGEAPPARPTRSQAAPQKTARKKK